MVLLGSHGLRAAGRLVGIQGGPPRDFEDGERPTARRSRPYCRDRSAMIDVPPPTLRLRIDADALAGNWRALDRLSGRAGWAAIKADCYGLGIDRCLPVLREAGARDFFVAHWQEVAPALRHIAADRSRSCTARSTRPKPPTPAQRRAPVIIRCIRRVSGPGRGRPCDLMIDTGIIVSGSTPSRSAIRLSPGSMCRF